MSDFSELCVFVYGTLKPGGHYHQRYCSDYLTEAIPAAVRGRLYAFPDLGYPAMTWGKDWVKGYVLKFVQPEPICQQILQRLDVLEGFQSESLEADNEYERQQVFAVLLDEERSLVGENQQLAWAYFMAAEKVRSLGGIYLSSGNWPVS
ncbi:MAG: gamma-glutamylcyclotransferase family protein [Cyanobacteria bacterium J06626_6]